MHESSAGLDASLRWGEQISTEMGTKRFGSAAGLHLVASKEGEISLARREGVILVGQQPFALIIPRADGSTDVRWNDPLVTKCASSHGHSSGAELKDKILASFAEASAAASPAAGLQARIDATTWCP